MRIKKIISCVLCAALLLTFLPAPAHAVTLTAINDSILPLDESTMPGASRQAKPMWAVQCVYYGLGSVSLGE